MRIAVYQADTKWLKKNENLREIENYVKQNHRDFDILVLPEMFLTGFCMNPKKSAIAENDRAVEKLISLCKKYKVAIFGSLAIKEDRKYYNRGLFITGKGIKFRYDKEYLFSHTGEQKRFSRKYPPTLFKYKGWKIMPKICYDLRFPENVRKLPSADLIIYVANWPAERIHHWQTLLRARAIENQSFVIGCNRIGSDQNGLSYPGQSMLVKPDGASIVMDFDAIPSIFNLKKKVLKSNRSTFKFQADKK